VKRRTVIVSSAASDDLAGLLDYVMATQDVAAAVALDRRLDDALATLAQVPDRGRVVPELRARGIGLYRELIRPPYRIVYRVTGAEVWVLAVVDGRRDLDGLLFDAHVGGPTAGTGTGTGTGTGQVRFDTPAACLRDLRYFDRYG
jgi:toxin ParE1/3/4